MINWKIANRWGWFLAVGTILTALSLIPIVVENPALEWLEWFGAVAGFPMMIFRPTSSAGFIAVGVIGFFANTIVLAVIFSLALNGVRYFRRRQVAHP